MERKRGNGRKKRILHSQPEGSRRVASLKKHDREEERPLALLQSRDGHQHEFLRSYSERLIPLRLSQQIVDSAAVVRGPKIS